MSLSLLLALPWLGCDRAGGDDSESASGTARPQIDAAQLVVEADLRRDDAALVLAFLRGDSSHRALAARGLGEIGSEGALALLHRGLADSDPSVRAASSFGLAQSGLPFDSLFGAAAAERDPQVTGLILRDLGRVTDRSRAGPLFRALERSVSRDACRGLRALASRDPELPSEVVRRLVELSRDPDPATAAACLSALELLAPSALAPHASHLALSARAARTLDPDLQHAWLRVVSRSGADSLLILLEATSDPDAAVAALAFQLLARAPRLTAAVYRDAIERRLGRFLSAARTEADPVALEAGFDAAPRVGGMAALSGWLRDVLQRLAPDPAEVSPVQRASVRVTVARALDQLEGSAAHLQTGDFSPLPDWVARVAWVEAIFKASGSESKRLQQLATVFEVGEWHVQRAVMEGARALGPAGVTPLLLPGLNADHLEVKAAALESLAVLAPQLRTATAPLPADSVAPIRAAFQAFHVTHHLRGLRAFLSLVRLARLRAELGSVTVLARSGIAPVRLDALSLLDEWGHPPPTQQPEPVANPISRGDLLREPVSVSFRSRAGNFTITFDPQLAPAAVSRLIQSFAGATTGLEVSGWAPGHHVHLTRADGLGSIPLRSETSRAPIVRGSVIVPGVRDGLDASILIRLAPAPELEGEVTVVGRVTQGLDVLGQIVRGETVTRVSPSQP